MKKYAVMFLVFGLACVATAQVQINPTNQIKPGSKTRAQILVTDTLSTTPEAQKGFFHYVNLSDEVHRIAVTTISNLIDTSVIYSYLGNEGVIPAQNPPAIPSKAVNTSGEFYQYINSSWRFIGKFLMASPQTIIGNKSFTDSVTIGKKLTTNGGISTTGNSTTAALTSKGVKAEGDTTVISNFSLNGSYGTIKADCSLQDIILTLPNTTTSFGWVYSIAKKDNTNHKVIIKDSNNNIITNILSPLVIQIKNSNSTWEDY